MSDSFKRRQIIFYTVFAFAAIGCVGITPAAMAADQIITLTATPSSPEVSDTFTVDVGYDVSDANNTLIGVGVRIFYDSSKVQYNSYDNWYPTGRFGTVQNPDDGSDLDGDTDTDKYIQFAFINFAGGWPDESLPIKMIDLNFTMLEPGTSISSVIYQSAGDYGVDEDTLTFDAPTTTTSTSSTTSTTSSTKTSTTATTSGTTSTTSITKTSTTSTKADTTTTTIDTKTTIPDTTTTTTATSTSTSTMAPTTTTTLPGCIGPNTPILSVPANNAANVIMMPVLETGTFSDPQGKPHTKTHWQISKDQQIFSNDNLVVDEVANRR